MDVCLNNSVCAASACLATALPLQRLKIEGPEPAIEMPSAPALSDDDFNVSDSGISLLPR